MPTEILYSIVVPVYNEEAILPMFVERLTRLLEGMGEPFEIIFVNDGSRDTSPSLLREFRAKDERVKYVSLSRNFGHQVAITAGLDHAAGAAVVVMDADLQDPLRSFHASSSSGGRDSMSSSPCGNVAAARVCSSGERRHCFIDCCVA